MKDEMFLLGKRGAQCHRINIYDRNNMTKAKYFIKLPRLYPKSIEACSVSNCVYILSSKRHYRCSILRLARDGERWSTVTPLISDIDLQQPSLCVTASGNLIISGEQAEELAATGHMLSVWVANGSLQRVIRLPRETLKSFLISGT